MHEVLGVLLDLHSLVLGALSRLFRHGIPVSLKVNGSTVTPLDLLHEALGVLLDLLSLVVLGTVLVLGVLDELAVLVLGPPEYSSSSRILISLVT